MTDTICYCGLCYLTYVRGMKWGMKQTGAAVFFCLLITLFAQQWIVRSPDNSPTVSTNQVRIALPRPAKIRAPQLVPAASMEAEDSEPKAINHTPLPKAPVVAVETHPGAEPPAELLERARNGEASAQRDLGKFYNDHGNIEEANVWYVKAAEQGDAEAQRIMGIRYTFGQGVERDMKEAGKWFLLAAQQGDVIAQRELGKVYGDQWKYTESNEWYLKAALQGDAEAQRILGLRYTIGQGVASNREEAVKWFTMAANQGDPVAQRELGKYYGEKWQLPESNEWYLKAASQGDIRAQHMMGVRYTFGQGVERNIEEAGKWFLLAAEQGDAQSQYSIGLRWARGEAGEPKDFAEAAKWFRLSAEQGLDEAQLRLGQRYAEGSGVKQDFVEAYKWLTLAQTQGKVQGAGTFLDTIRPQMTPEQIAEAQEQVKAFVAKPPAPIKPQ
ncbi:MAG: Sel1 domain protein repeat-containing protein [Verrucomicrobiales bacterium]|nr:Sel1 domain protein repeat-containing protein [Verrucomicrobiales bacterium]